MKTTRNALFALLLLGACAGAASAQPSVGVGGRVGPRGHASVDLGFFYDSLAPYGNWIERPSRGWVWTPRDVSASWRPYQAGHWVWSDQGWTWLSDEPYGWATYHYGRWYQDPEIGWAWVPGNDWAPAWVSWQEGNDYVGWAPLPPGANVNASNAPGPGVSPGAGPGYDDGQPYDDNAGYDQGPANDNGPAYENGPAYDSAPVYDSGYGDDGGYGGYTYGIAPAAYLFVPTRAFLSVDLFDFFVPWVRVSSFFRFTHNCTAYSYYGGRFFDRGIPFEHVRHFYRDVPRYRLSELDGFRGHGFQMDGNRLAFFRPQVNRGWRGSPLDRPDARRSVVTVNQFRNDHPDRQWSRPQDNRRAFPTRQAQGDRGDRNDRNDRGDRNVQRWQDQASRQRTFDNGRQQAQRQQQFDAQRQQRWQRPQEPYRPQRSFDDQSRWQRGQPQRQSPPQRQPDRGQTHRQDNRSRDNRGQTNHGHDNRGQNHDRDRRHGG